MVGSIAVSVLIGTFIACSVEVTEMVIIVVGVGATRGWRSTWIGAGAGLVVLAGIVAGLGQALQLIPINTVRIVIGALLLTFGLQWYRKGVIQVAADGFTGGAEEEDVAGDGDTGGIVDWTAFVLAFKGVVLEGLEVAFIVVAFGSGGGRSGSYTTAYIGAGAAFVIIGALGLIAKQQLEKVPGRTLKFGVGGLLSTFGTFWALEGLGVSWPAGDVSLAWLYALYLGSTFAIMYAVRSGSFGRLPSSGLQDPGATGPSGLAPASDTAIRDFQSAHGLSADGIVGPRTQASVRALRAEHDGDLELDAVGIDAGDSTAIAEFQQRVALAATGVIDAETQGAIRLFQHPAILDPLDTEAVAAFQRRHGLVASGDLDEQTRIALGAALSEAGGGSQNSQEEPTDGTLDPVTCFREIDPADEDSVSQFQESLGIEASGDIDAPTRGALRAMRALMAVNPLDGQAVRVAQRRHELEPDGVIATRTRAAIADERRSQAEHWDGSAPSEPDVFEEEAVQRFQRRHRLQPDGVVGPLTRQRILWEREHHLDVDAARPESVRAFQEQHGLRVDGVAGPRTQAAMAATRSEREPDEENDRRERYGDTAVADGRVLEATDPDSVRDFQRAHRLTPDGVIGEQTQAAMRSVRRVDDGGDGTRSQGSSSGGLVSRLGDLVVGFGRFWWDFIIGDDWVAAAGVGVMVGGVYGLLQADVIAYWFGPVAVLSVALITVRRALFRASAVG